jgi:hypothetical protein
MWNRNGRFDERTSTSIKSNYSKVMDASTLNNTLFGRRNRQYKSWQESNVVEKIIIVIGIAVCVIYVIFSAYVKYRKYRKYRK